MNMHLRTSVWTEKRFAFNPSSKQRDAWTWPQSKTRRARKRSRNLPTPNRLHRKNVAHFHPKPGTISDDRGLWNESEKVEKLRRCAIVPTVTSSSFEVRSAANQNAGLLPTENEMSPDNRKSRTQFSQQTSNFKSWFFRFFKLYESLVYTAFNENFLSWRSLEKASLTH